MPRQNMFWVCEEHPGRPYSGSAGARARHARPVMSRLPVSARGLPADFTARFDIDKGPIN